MLTYNLAETVDFLGNYVCIADNEMGSGKAELKVTGSPSEPILTTEKSLIYSDAVVFRWSTMSGSPIQELVVQVILLKFFFIL